MKNTSMYTTAGSNPFKEVLMKNEQIYELLQKNCIENFLGNQKILFCKKCKKLNIEAKICQKCKLSICFFCQKNHLCNRNNKNNTNMLIDETVRDEIKKLKFRCMNE